MTVVTSEPLSFFPPDMFGEDRDAILGLIHEVGTDPAQKFILGERVARFEQALRDYTGARDVIACSSGTGGLELALDAAGIGPDDEVAVPAFCCQPVASSVVNRGARPVFVDVDPHRLVMDPEETEAAIGERTKALMPAHLFSIMADMPAMREIASRHDLTLIEDAAVAQGAVLQDLPAGRWGDLGVFSFFQVKALGGIGEGGVVLTDDPELGERVRMFRNHGQDGKTRFLHHLVGRNSRMDEIFAGFLLHRLPRLGERLERRAQIAGYYTERFEGFEEAGLLPPPPGREGRCYYVYTLLSERRDELREFLFERGISTHVYYPLPLPHQPAFAAFATGRQYPAAGRAGRRNLALPIYPHLTDAQVERIADTVVDFHQRSGVGA
jgi:dTDP-4-amino-4,6-dideoxygalactose transaminase